MVKIFKNHWPVLCLILLEILLFISNYRKETFFLGWDNLFPEMNFRENLRRSFFSVWQEYRGLGLLDGMSFAANLPHYLFLWLGSLILPDQLLRYLFIFFMHFLGGAGIYFLIVELTGFSIQKKLAAFFAALFYLFNIGTVQVFFAPYELFTVHFAALPLLVLSLIKYLKRRSQKTLLFFILMLILTVPQAHVPTVFIVFILAVSSVLAFHLIFTGKRGVPQIIIVLFAVFSVNSFWGLPYLYSALNNASVISASKINEMATDDIYLKNKAYGNLSNVVLMKGFSLDFIDNLSSRYMMEAWRIHIDQPLFKILGFSFFALISAGFIAAVKNREKRFYPFIAMFAFAFLMLADDTPLIGGVAFFLRTHIPYFDQIFRFTFTKFFILYAFSAAVLLGLGVSLIERFLRSFSVVLIISIFSLLAFAYYSLPAWEGNFLYDRERLKIPEEYFMLVDFFKKQDRNSRVALLPQTSIWGWTYNDWGYEGSGFIWYGIPQATLDGAFYPWSRQNENYYWELTQAFFQKNKALFEAVLEKYQINWLVLDYSLKSPLSPDVSYENEILKVIEESEKLQLAQDFGRIKVYQVYSDTKIRNFTFMETGLVQIGPDYKWDSLDQAYLDHGNYITSDNGLSTDSFYPFRSLFTAKKQTDLEFSVVEEEEFLSFKAVIPKEIKGKTLIIPEIMQNGIMADQYPQIYFDNRPVDYETSALTLQKISLGQTEGRVLEVRVPKIKNFIDNILPALLNLSPAICNQFNKGIFRYDTVRQESSNFLKMTSIGSDNCLTLRIPGLPQRFAYLISVESRHEEGKSLLFAVINPALQRPDLEVNLPNNNRNSVISHFILPPMGDQSLGYTLYFDNISYGRTKTVNNLGKITVNPVPYQFLKSLKLVSNLSEQPQKRSINIQTDHPNPALYKVKIEGQKESLSNAVFVLSQSFDKGWKMYEVNNLNFFTELFPFFFGKEVKEHVLINNWENGWRVKTDETLHYVVVYLPQYLEYMGFAILLGALIMILTRRGKYGLL